MKSESAAGICDRWSKSLAVGTRIGWCIGLWLVIAAQPAMAADWASVLVYQRFGIEGRSSTNIRLDQFEAHLAELKAGGYTVASLADVIDAFETGAELADRTVVLTIDGGFRSVYDQAWPRLREAGLPFTLFLASGTLSSGSGRYMTWSQIREMQASGLVTIGSQGNAHASMPARSVAANQGDLGRARKTFEGELGLRPDLFAYPFGHHSRAVEKLVGEAGHRASFAQNSGVAHARADRMALPRFAMSEQFGGLDRLRLVGNALPLPVGEVTPPDTRVEHNPPLVGFTVDPDLGERLNRLACFAQGQGKVRVERLGASRVEVRLNEPLTYRRNRVNCTMPGPDGRWRWYGRQFFVPQP
ncbi:MAG: polysaccharide deacetylase family protein [Alphaproteobacteria bacterium]|nr:polysaccharide deacetylase family protein [Alphaproteobacteria bacterium]